MTRLAVAEFCTVSKLWHQGCLAFQSQRPCQGVMRHNFLKKHERRVSFFYFSFFDFFDFSIFARFFFSKIFLIFDFFFFSLFCFFLDFFIFLIF